MKKLIIYIPLLALIMSCTKEFPQDIPADDSSMLNFSCIKRTMTKAGTHGSKPGTANENMLETIDYWIFPEGGTDQGAVFHAKFSPNTNSGTASTRQAFNVESINDIFPPGARTCEIFAVANYDASALGNSPTLQQLLDAKVNTDFRNPADPESFVMVSVDDETGEIGTATVKLISRDNTTAATGEVKLKRLASKVSIQIHIEKDAVIFNQIHINGNPHNRVEIWKPQMDNIQVYFNNSAVNANLGGVPFLNQQEQGADLVNYAPGQRALTTEFEERSYYSYGYQRDENGYILLDGSGNPTQITGSESRTGRFYNVEPFYSYPQEWQYGFTYEPNIKLVIPWERQAGADSEGMSYGYLSKAYYYKVMCHGTQISSSEATLKGNNWYKIFVNVGILGSEIDEGETNINGWVSILDWQNISDGETSEDGEFIDKETEISGARYLSVPENEYVLHNQNSLSIPFTTSHDCEIIDFKATYNDYYNNGADNPALDQPANIPASSVKIESGRLVFDHPLANFGEGSTDYDVSEFTIEFKIRHISDHSYVETIKIMQKPAIMISHEKSDANAYVNNGSGGNYGGNPANNFNNSNNKNPNMYIITTTVLPASSGYMIGDPRDDAYTNESSWSSTADAIAGNDRKLLNYRRVDPTRASDNIIAPKIRIASSYGACQPMSKENAIRRCASYQEHGYPAGRWRVPTMAEIFYMAQLTTDGFIPRLLGSTSGGTTDYWCNSGYVTIHGGTSTIPPEYENGTGGTRYVRCVYDDWYWGNVKEEYRNVTPHATFKWGDMTELQLAQ